MNASMIASLRYRSVMKGPFKISISYEFITKNQITKIKREGESSRIKSAFNPLYEEHCAGESKHASTAMNI